jgi:trimethylamine:corrinoid methyltransferase-like protein
MDLISSVGIGGSFLDTDHTRYNFREELWEPCILNRRARGSGSLPLENAALQEVRKILENEHESCIEPAEQNELRKIEKHYRDTI